MLLSSQRNASDVPERNVCEKIEGFRTADVVLGAGIGLQLVLFFLVFIPFLKNARKKNEYNEIHVVTAQKVRKNGEEYFRVPYDAEMECKQNKVVYDSNTTTLREPEDARKKNEYNDIHIVTAKKVRKNEEEYFGVPYDAELECKQNKVVYDSNKTTLREPKDARKKNEYNDIHIVTAKKVRKNEEEYFGVSYDAELECKQNKVVYDSNTTTLREPKVLRRSSRRNSEHRCMENEGEFKPILRRSFRRDSEHRYVENKGEFKPILRRSFRRDSEHRCMENEGEFKPRLQYLQENQEISSTKNQGIQTDVQMAEDIFLQIWIEIVDSIDEIISRDDILQKIEKLLKLHKKSVSSIMINDTDKFIEVLIKLQEKLLSSKTDRMKYPQTSWPLPKRTRKNRFTYMPTTDKLTMATDEDTINIYLVGVSGEGKSATGNTILGENKFAYGISAVQITRTFETESVNRFGHSICITECPGSNLTFVLEEIQQRIGMHDHQNHVIVFVVRAKRFSNEQKTLIETVGKNFKDSNFHQSIVLFTGRDELERYGLTLNDYIAKAPSDIRNFIRKCGDRYIAFNNCESSKGKENQAEELVKLIQKTIINK